MRTPSAFRKLFPAALLVTLLASPLASQALVDERVVQGRALVEDLGFQAFRVKLHDGLVVYDMPLERDVWEVCLYDPETRRVHETGVPVFGPDNSQTRFGRVIGEMDEAADFLPHFLLHQRQQHNHREFDYWFFLQSFLHPADSN